MESVFMERTRFPSAPPPPLSHYCPTQTRALIRDEKNICLSPARTFFKHDELAGDCHGNKTTPTTIWSLQPDHTEEEGEGESTMSSSQYNECWQSTSTVKTSKQDEEEEEVEEVEEGEGRGEGEEGEGEGEEGGQDVDGATGQSTIAKYIERFRMAPPTPRGGRKQRESGVGGKFWWQDPSTSGGPILDPPLNHSTPSSTSTETATTAKSMSPGGRGRCGNTSLGERSQQTLKRSSVLLATTTVADSVKLPPPPPLPPFPLSCRGGGVEEEDILYQWRLRRRLEQAHRSTTMLTAKLGVNGLPLFKSQSTTAGMGYGRTGVWNGDTRQSPVQSHSPSCEVGQCVTPRPLAPSHHSPEVHTHHSPQHTPGAPRHHSQVAPDHHSQGAPHHHSQGAPRHHASGISRHHSQVAPRHHTAEVPTHSTRCCHCCVPPPHRHTGCDILPCNRCDPAIHPPPSVNHDRRTERQREIGRNSRREERGKEIMTEEEVLSQQVPPPREVIDKPQPTASSAVRYPSPSLLDHMRQSSRSCDEPHPPIEDKEDTAWSPSLSETLLSSNGTLSPVHHNPHQCSAAGGLISQAVEQHLFQNEIREDESIVSLPSEYDDMGDHLLKALIVHARALEDQLRKIHNCLSSAEES